jgi:hypothetical protein
VPAGYRTDTCNTLGHKYITAATRHVTSNDPCSAEQRGLMSCRAGEWSYQWDPAKMTILHLLASFPGGTRRPAGKVLEGSGRFEGSPSLSQALLRLLLPLSHLAGEPHPSYLMSTPEGPTLPRHHLWGSPASASRMQSRVKHKGHHQHLNTGAKDKTLLTREMALQKPHVGHTSKTNHGRHVQQNRFRSCIIYMGPSLACTVDFRNLFENDRRVARRRADSPCKAGQSHALGLEQKLPHRLEKHFPILRP